MLTPQYTDMRRRAGREPSRCGRGKKSMQPLAHCARPLLQTPLPRPKILDIHPGKCLFGLELDRVAHGRDGGARDVKWLRIVGADAKTWHSEGRRPHVALRDFARFSTLGVGCWRQRKADNSARIAGIRAAKVPTR